MRWMVVLVWLVAVVIVALAAGLVGCATTYKAKGIGGGYSGTQLDENIFTVTFRGNGYTDMERATDFTLLRSAEVALDHGYKFFSVIESGSSVSQETYTTPTTSTTTGSGTVSGNSFQGTAKTVTTGGQTYHISRPSTSNTIICYTERPAEGVAYNAAFVYVSIAQKYGILGY